MIDKINFGKIKTGFRKIIFPQPKGKKLIDPKDKVNISPQAQQVSGEKSDAPALPKKKWTVFFYVDGNNNLAPMAFHSFSSLKKVGSDQNVNLVSQLAITGYEAERGLIGKPGKTDKNFFPGSEVIGAKDMGDPKTLQEFLEWGIKKYPAEKYALVLWNHGAGFMGSMVDEKTHSLIDNQELAGVLKNIKDQNGKPIDLLNFNACLMGQTEVAYPLREVARYMVGSEETEAGFTLPLPGLYGTTPQHKVMEDLKKGVQEKGDITSEELAKLYVYESKHQFASKIFTPTQSAIDLEKMGAVKESADKLAASMLWLLEKKPALLKEVRKAMSATQHFLALDMFRDPYQDFGDLGDFAKHILRNKKLAGDAELKASAQQVINAVKEAVIAEHHSVDSIHGKTLEGSTGLSVYLPPDYGYDRPYLSSGAQYGPSHGYEKTAFAQETKWEDFLKLVAEDKAFYRFLKARGVSDQTIDKIEKTTAGVKKLEERVLPALQSEGYQQAKRVLEGHTSPNFFWTPIGMAGGLVRSFKGATKLVKSLTEPYRPSRRVELGISGVIDAVVGAGSVVCGAAMFAGAGSLAGPSAIAVLGLGLGRVLYEVATQAANDIKSRQHSVSEKLQTMDEA